MIGKEDHFNLRTVREYNSWLKQNKVTTSLVEFSGGHEIPKRELKQILRDLTK
jgi:hypothetical protein